MNETLQFETISSILEGMLELVDKLLDYRLELNPNICNQTLQPIQKLETQGYLKILNHPYP